MTRARAIRLAIDAMHREIKRLAVQGNLHTLYGLDNVHNVQAASEAGGDDA